jgi:hypothetical protein
MIFAPKLLYQELLFLAPGLPVEAGTAGFIDTPLLLWGQLGVHLVPDLAQAFEVVVLNG